MSSESLKKGSESFFIIAIEQSSASRQGDISVRSNIDFSNEVTDYSLSSSHSQFSGGGF